MSFQQMPNEILAKIFLLLDFKDLQQCSQVCARFTQFVQQLVQKCHYDVWAPSTPRKAISTVCTTSHSLFVVFADGAAEFFEMSLLDGNLYRTLHESKRKHWKRISRTGIIPDTKSFVYTIKGTDQSTEQGKDVDVPKFFVYSMESDRSVWSGQTSAIHGKGQVRATRIRCSREAIALSGDADGNPVFLVYSWDGLRATFLACFNACWPCLAQLSAQRGLLACVSNENKTRIRFFDAHWHTEIGMDVGRKIGRIFLNDDGSLLAVRSDDKLVSLIDLPSGEIIYSQRIEWVSHIVFSDLDRHLLAVVDTDTITLLHLKPKTDQNEHFNPEPKRRKVDLQDLSLYPKWECNNDHALQPRSDGNEPLELDFSQELLVPEGFHCNTLVFRSVSGSRCLQLVTYAGVLMLYRLNFVTKQWQMFDNDVEM